MYEGGIDDYLLLALGEQVGEVAEVSVAAAHTVPSSIVGIDYSRQHRASSINIISQIFSNI